MKEANSELNLKYGDLSEKFQKLEAEKSEMGELNQKAQAQIGSLLQERNNLTDELAQLKSESRSALDELSLHLKTAEVEYQTERSELQSQLDVRQKTLEGLET